MTHPGSPASTPTDSPKSGSATPGSETTPLPLPPFTRISVPKELVERARKEVVQHPELFAQILDRVSLKPEEHAAVMEVATSAFVMGFLYSLAPDVKVEKT